MYVWGAAQRGTPPQINVVGSLMFLLALIAVVQVAARRRSERRLARRRRPALRRDLDGCALADAHRPFWLDDPAPSRPPGPVAGEARPTCSSSAAASPACGPRCWPRRPTPSATCCWSRAAASAGRPPVATAASAPRRLTHGLRQRVRPLARRDRRPRTDGSREPRRHRGRRSSATASTATSSAPARSPSPPSPHQLDGFEEAASTSSRARRRRPRCSTPTQAAPSW